MDTLRPQTPPESPPPALGGLPSAAAPSAPGRTGARERIVFVDVARSLVIFGALTLHCLLTFNVWDQVPVGAGKALANGFFRACTPTFFLLFGLMLEWVYVAQRERDGAAAVARRLAGRAGQCYLGLALGACAATLGGGLAAADLPLALAGMVEVPMSSVLRFYAVAMLLCIPVVILRPRLGWALPLALVAVVWAVAPLLPLLPWPEPGSTWAFTCSFLVGQPPRWVAGSVWHNLSLVFLGMYLGHHMRSRLSAGLTPLGGAPVVVLVGLCAAVTAVSAATLGVEGLLQGYFGTAMLLRSHCHPAYFAIATLTALMLLWTAQRLFPVGARAQRRWPLMALGRHSLLAFAAGNACLNLLAGTRPPLWLGVALTGASMLTLCVALELFDRRTRSSR